MSSLDVAVYEPRDLKELHGMCKAIATSQLMPTALRGKPADVMLVAWKGRELGFTFQQSLGSIHVIEGKATLSAEAMGALVMRSPVCQHLTIMESTDEVATYRTQRVGADAAVTMSYTMTQAKRAGLASKKNWQAHPDAMLRARALSRICRAVYPDLVMGLYVDGEIERTPSDPAPRASLAETIESMEPAKGGAVPPPEEIEAEDAAFEVGSDDDGAGEDREDEPEQSALPGVVGGAKK